jgi:hypothetical protein
MKGHSDYELKQSLVDHSLAKQKGLEKEGSKFTGEKETFGKQLADLHKLSEPSVLKNFDVVKL